MSWVVVKDPQGGERRSRIPEGGSLVCGRSRHVDISLVGGTLSRRHAIFFNEDGHDWVEDAGSKNGTLLNGDPIQSRRRLAEGDQITVGIHVIQYTRRERGAPPPAPKAPSRPPRQVTPAGVMKDTHRWRAVRRVGVGGMGEVYHAFDRDLGVAVALKRIRRSREADRSLLERLHAREAAIGRTIRHPNVVQTLEDGIHDGDLYMLMEWVDGMSLDRRLTMTGREELGRPERIEILRQIALGLEAAHDAGVVHADLKPANILLLPETPQTSSRANLRILERPDEAPDPADETLNDDLGDEIARRAGVPEAPELERPPFVARESELELLQQLDEEARDSGELRWVLLFGAQGVGKKRLVREFLEGHDEGARDGLHVIEDFTAPPEDATGLWISILPSQFPDDARLRRAYDRNRVVGTAFELHLQPLLRGQAIRLVESIVRHRPSARAFVDAVELEVGGLPSRLLDALKRAIEDGMWVRSGGGHRFRAEAFHPDPTTVARALLERLRGEEKGLRDLLSSAAPLGACLDFEILQAASGIERAGLYYLLGYAEEQGYLQTGAQSNYTFVNEPFRQALAAGLEPEKRAAIAKRALEPLARRLEQPGAPVAMYIDGATLLRESGHVAQAFRWYLEASLVARSCYDATAFLRGVDEARDCYRKLADKGRSKEISEVLDRHFGSAGRGLAGIDRLRRLPREVAVKITDFGISRRYDRDDDGSASAEPGPWGTPRYMSPEQVKREALGPASDIFSLAILCREVLEGEHPLRSLKGKAAMSAIVGGSVMPPTKGRSQVPEIGDLLGRMLDADPSVRPSAGQVAHELQALQLKLLLAESRT